MYESPNLAYYVCIQGKKKVRGIHKQNRQLC